jgi:hypothetical protein
MSHNFVTICLISERKTESVLEFPSKVTIGTMQLVKVVTKVAIGATALACLATGLNILTNGTLAGALENTIGSSFGLAHETGWQQGLVPMLGFMGSIGLWGVADRIQGKLEVNQTKSVQEKELQRIENQHGQPLSRA